MTSWRPRDREEPENADRPSLEAVLEHYGVTVKGRTKQMVHCPLHEERGKSKSPSCSIRLDEGLWHCMSCGRGGSSWDLIMAMEGVNFERARAIAADLGFAAGGAERSRDAVSGSAYAGRRSVPRSSGDRPANGGYKPSWRR